MILTIRQKLFGVFGLSLFGMTAVVGSLFYVKAKVASLQAQSAMYTKDELLGAIDSVIIINVLTMMAAATATWWLAKTMTAYIVGLGKAADQLAAGSVDAKIDWETDDEIGQLSTSMKAVAANVQACAKAAEQIAAGDLSVEIKMASEDDVLAKSMIRVVDTLRGLVSEAAVMRAAAVEGRLETRGDAAKFEGGYRDIIQGFNDTLEAVVTPMNVAAEYIDQISRGILPEPITEDYKGNFAAIKNNLNKCIAALDAMRQDVRTMCIAALEGRLDARVDATKHEGVYMKIVQGLDDVIDAVVNPINESAAVLERLAENDLTARVEGSYQGDHAKIKDSVNTAMGTLLTAMMQVEEASEKVASSAESLSVTSSEVGKASQQVAETIGQVAAGSQEQSRTVQASALAMDQLTRAIQEIATGAQNQAKTVEGTVALVQQSAAAVEEVAKLSQTASVHGRQVAEIASAGGQQVEDAVESMARIKEATDQVAEMVRQLGESSQQIGAIVETIDDIAAQTNLLALNAAIEAARAGEHGKGFAVVADEVRKLAERSSKATGEIAELIASIQSMTAHAVEAMDRGAKEVEEGAELGNQAGVALGKIQNAVSDIVGQIENMSAAAQQMAAGTNEVIRAIESVSAITEETTAAAEEMSASSSEVVQQIEQVAAVSEENAAAAEEVSATTQEQNAAVEEMTAATEELARMAGQLQELVAQFKIGDRSARDLRMAQDLRRAA